MGKHSRTVNRAQSADISQPKSQVIDPFCFIFKAGKGFCWAPKSAWGMSENQLCKKCMMKNLTCRYCGRNEREAKNCDREECGNSKKNNVVVSFGIYK